jgi:hypothetical protein
VLPRCKLGYNCHGVVAKLEPGFYIVDLSLYSTRDQKKCKRNAENFKETWIGVCKKKCERNENKT